MSRKNMTIGEQFEKLQEAGRKVAEYEKAADRICQIYFGRTAKEIKLALGNSPGQVSDFESAICSYFGLYLDTDKKDFLSVFCTDSSQRYFASKRGENM